MILQVPLNTNFLFNLIGGECQGFLDLRAHFCPWFQFPCETDAYSEFMWLDTTQDVYFLLQHMVFNFLPPLIINLSPSKPIGIIPNTLKAWFVPTPAPALSIQSTTAATGYTSVRSESIQP